MSDYLTTDEAAAIIRMDPDYVRRQCKAGQIKAKKLGNEWRIGRAELDAFMSGGAAAPTRDRSSARQRRKAA